MSTSHWACIQEVRGLVSNATSFPRSRPKSRFLERIYRWRFLVPKSAPSSLHLVVHRSCSLPAIISSNHACTSSKRKPSTRYFLHRISPSDLGWARSHERVIARSTCVSTIFRLFSRGRTPCHRLYSFTVIIDSMSLLSSLLRIRMVAAAACVLCKSFALKKTTLRR